MNIDDAAWREVMGAKVGDSNLSHFEVYSLGHALLNWTQTVYRLGHSSPGSTLDYTAGVNGLFALVIRDFVAWTSGRNDMVPGDPRKRLEEYLEAANWEDQMVNGVQADLAEVAA